MCDRIMMNGSAPYKRIVATTSHMRGTESILRPPIVVDQRKKKSLWVFAKSKEAVFLKSSSDGRGPRLCCS